MLTQRYIDTVFKSLEAALELGLVSEWSIHGPNFVIHRGSERTTVEPIQAADYLIDLFRKHKATSEDNPHK